MSNDDPVALARTAASMANFGDTRGAKHHPWWALAASVDGLIELAGEPGPLQEPAMLAVQIMAAVYNKRVGAK